MTQTTDLRAQADPDIASVIGDSHFAAQQGLLMLCDLLTPACRAVESRFDRAEWNLIADATNGCWPSIVHTGMMRSAPAVLVEKVSDSIRVIQLDQKWLAKANPIFAAKRGKWICTKLAELTDLKRCAVVLAVQFLWARTTTIDMKIDPWWTLDFRREVIVKAAAKAAP